MIIIPITQRSLEGIYSFHFSDINMCNTPEAGCEHLCTNIGDSFICSCLSGFTLDSDGRRCNGKNLASLLVFHLQKTA